MFDKRYRFLVNVNHHAYDSMEDEKYLSKFFYYQTNYPLNLSNPQTFNEKMQWLKINNRNSYYTLMVDKYEAKRIVGSRVGYSHVVKTLGVYDTFDEIDFNKLPSKFVLKCTHGCGRMFICKNKEEINVKKLAKMFDAALRENYFYHTREWPYKNVKPRIIAEEFIADDSFSTLVVYKVFCFNGVPTIIQVIQDDKQPNETIDYFDVNWNLLDLKQNFPNSVNHISKPTKLEEMLSLSKEFSKGFPFLRTDWYIVGGRVLFSEFTFFSDAGLEPFHPNKWDVELGSLIELPNSWNYIDSSIGT